MGAFGIVLAVLIFLVVSGLIFSVAFTFYVAWRVYLRTLIRPENEKRERKCSDNENPQHVLMFEKGLEWASLYTANKTDVSIENDGLKLLGEYYDFGFERAVIILPGRTESLAYSYYYAEPYRKAEFNVLVIDSRATGLSDGVYFSMGELEKRDVIKWGYLLKEKFGVKTVFLHGICIGSSTAVYTLISKDCPDFFTGMCADGMYKNFFEIFRLHMKEWNRPAFPVAYEVMAILRIKTGANCLTYGPYKAVKKLDKPILFIYTDKDQYALPKESRKVFANCASHDKEIRWFSTGSHSHIRISDEEGYDSTILEWTAKRSDIL